MRIEQKLKKMELLALRLIEEGKLDKASKLMFVVEQAQRTNPRVRRQKLTELTTKIATNISRKRA
jgi:hypothetical protein